MSRDSQTAAKILASVLAISFLSYAIALAALSSYQDAAQKCDQDIQKKLAQLSEEYASELSSLMDTFRARGDLEKTLAVKNEKERFANEKILEDKNLVEVPVQLRELQRKYLAAPKKAIEQIAKSYVADLEEIKRKLTIDDKLDEALAAQREVEKIQKKYGVVNPTRGGEFRSEDLPKYIVMTKDVSIPTIVDGQRVGTTGLSRGRAYELVKVDGPQLTIRVADSDVAVPVDATDLLRRIERKQQGLKEEDVEEGTEEQQTDGYALRKTEERSTAAVFIGTWKGGADGIWGYEFRRDHTASIVNFRSGWRDRGTWTVEGDSVVVHWNNGCWDRYTGPIRSDGTNGANCNGVPGKIRKVSK